MKSNDALLTSYERVLNEEISFRDFKEEFCRAYYARCLLLASKILGSTDAQDALQEFWLKKILIMSRERFAVLLKVSNLEGFIHVAVRRHCYTYYNIRKQHGNFCDLDILEASKVKPVQGFSYIDSMLDYKTQLKRLPKKDAAIIDLRFIGHSIKEIAEKFSISEKAAKMRLCRARKKLRQLS